MENKNELGLIEISNNAFKDVIRSALSRFDELEASKKENNFIELTNKNDEIKLLLHIKIKQGIDISKISKLLQEEIHDTIELMMGIDLKVINLSIDGFIV